MILCCGAAKCKVGCFCSISGHWHLSHPRGKSPQMSSDIIKYSSTEQNHSWLKHWLKGTDEAFGATVFKHRAPLARLYLKQRHRTIHFILYNSSAKPTYFIPFPPSHSFLCVHSIFISIALYLNLQNTKINYNSFTGEGHNFEGQKSSFKK